MEIPVGSVWVYSTYFNGMIPFFIVEELKVDRVVVRVIDIDHDRHLSVVLFYYTFTEKLRRLV